MKRIIVIAIALLSLAVAAVTVSRDPGATIQNPTIPTARFDALNAVVQESYATWTSSNTDVD